MNKKFKKIILGSIALVSAIGVGFGGVTNVSAATHASASGGGGSGGRIVWSYPVHWNIRTGPFTARTGGGATFSAGNNEAIAYINAQVIQGAQVDGAGNPWWMPWNLGYITPTYTANWQAGYAGLATNFQNYLQRDGYSGYNLPQRGTNYVFNKGGVWLDAVTIPTVTYTTRTDVRTTLVKVTDLDHSNNKTTTPLNRDSDNPKTLYDSPTNSKPYGYTSVQNEYSYNHNITAYQVKVTKKWTQGSDGSVKDITYTKGAQTSASVNESWSVSRPSLKYTYFKPYDLRTEKIATDSIVTGEGYKVGSADMQMSVDNNLPKPDENNLPTLDTNDKFPFTVKFNNDQFGLPTGDPGFNIQNIDTMPSEESAGEGKQVYWNPKLHMGSSSVDYNPNRSSLQFGAEDETPDGKEILKDYGWKGGDFAFRSIKTGTYYLGVPGSSPSSKFWYMTYNTGIYFRYGHKYNGTVSTGGNVPTFSGRSNSDTRAFLDKTTNTVNQPVLYGAFDVKTVAGDNNPN